jgi:hypothetical protein
MAIGVAPDRAEEAWVERLVTFNEAEVVAARKDSSLAHWNGIVSRFEASVGPAPTERTQSVYQLAMVAWEKFESAAANDSSDELQEGGKLLAVAGEQLLAVNAEVTRERRPSSPLGFDVPAASEVRYASEAIVKRTKSSYGKNGLLLLTADRLVFLTGEAATSWSLPLSAIAHLKKPWYGMGSYLTFDVNGAYYACAFGRKSGQLASISSSSGLAIRYGGAAGVAAGVAGDAVAISVISKGAAIGKQWYSLLHP